MFERFMFTQLESPVQKEVFYEYAQHPNIVTPYWNELSEVYCHTFRHWLVSLLMDSNSIPHSLGLFYDLYLYLLKLTVHCIVKALELTSPNALFSCY